MQNLLRIITTVKPNRAKPGLKTLTIKPFFDCVKNIVPETILNYCTHNPPFLIPAIDRDKSCNKKIQPILLLFSSYSLRNVAEDVVTAPVGLVLAKNLKVFHRIFHKLVENF